MRAGVFLAYWPWFSVAEQVELAGEHGDAARACQEAFPAGDRERAAAALTPGLIDSMALAEAAR